MNIAYIIIASLVAPILVGVILNSLKNIKPLIIFQTIGLIPFQFDTKNRYNGAYLVEIKNISTKTIKDISLYIKTQASYAKIGGIKKSQGLQYAESIEDGEIKIEIPFLKENDELSVSIIVESSVSIPDNPEISIRSPHNLKVQSASTYFKKRKDAPFKLLLMGSAIAMIIFLSLFDSCGRFSSLFLEERKDVLIFSANVNGLYDLSNIYVNMNDLKYITQGDFIYAQAKLTKNPEDVKKYSNFLKTLFNYGNIIPKSKAVIAYNIAKIELTLNNSTEAEYYFKKAKLLDKDLVIKRLEYDEEAKRLNEK